MEHTASSSRSRAQSPLAMIVSPLNKQQTPQIHPESPQKNAKTPLRMRVAKKVKTNGQQSPHQRNEFIHRTL